MADVVYRAEFDFNVVGGGDGADETVGTGGDSMPQTPDGEDTQQNTRNRNLTTSKFIRKSLMGLAADTAIQVANTGINSYGSTISYATGNSYQQEKFQWGANITKTMASRTLGGAAAGAAVGSAIPGLGTLSGAAIGGGIGYISGLTSVVSSAYQAELKAAFQREIDLMHLRQIRKVTGLSSINNSRVISSSSLY